MPKNSGEKLWEKLLSPRFCGDKKPLSPQHMLLKTQRVRGKREYYTTLTCVKVFCFNHEHASHTRGNAVGWLLFPLSPQGLRKVRVFNGLLWGDKDLLSPQLLVKRGWKKSMHQREIETPRYLDNGIDIEAEGNR